MMVLGREDSASLIKSSVDESVWKILITKCKLCARTVCGTHWVVVTVMLPVFSHGKNPQD